MTDPPIGVTRTVPNPPKREQHKVRTQRALQQAALELFSRNGYDATTTEEIAELAGVSPRTFFRYFSTKESVLFVGEVRWLQSFATAFLAQPATSSDFEAARDALVDLSAGLMKSRRALKLYDKAVASSPTLRGRVQEHQQQDIATIAAAVATRRTLPAPDESCTLVGAVVLLVFNRARGRWLAGRASVDFAGLIVEEFGLLRSML